MMKIKINLKASSLFLIPFLTFVNANASIYKCVNAKEQVYYNDKPCPANEKESKINPVKDPEGGYIPPEFIADNEKNGTVSKSGYDSSSTSIDRKKRDLSKSQSLSKEGVNSQSLETNSLSGSADEDSNVAVSTVDQSAAEKSISNVDSENQLNSDIDLKPIIPMNQLDVINNEPVIN